MKSASSRPYPETAASSVAVGGAPQRDGPLLLRAEEAARLLGLGRSKVFQMMATGELPGVVRIGRAVRVSREALEAWVREGAGSGVPPG